MLLLNPITPVLSYMPINRSCFQIYVFIFYNWSQPLLLVWALVWAHPWRIGILSVTHPQRRVSLPSPAVSTNPFMLGFWLASCCALLILITTTVGSWVLQLACFLTRSSSPSNDNEDHILYFFFTSERRKQKFLNTY